VSWAQSAGGAAAVTGVVVSVSYGSGETSVQWRIVLPPGVTSVTQADLPAELDAFELGPASSQAITATVRLFELRDRAGYDAFRLSADPDAREVGNVDDNGRIGQRKRLSMSKRTVRIVPP